MCRKLIEIPYACATYLFVVERVLSGVFTKRLAMGACGIQVIHSFFLSFDQFDRSRLEVVFLSIYLIMWMEIFRSVCPFFASFTVSSCRKSEINGMKNVEKLDK